MITLKTLHQATAQQVFDQVAKHLLTQKERSIKEDKGCQYRGYNNLKCAAGCLISDEEYKKSMEGFTWETLEIRGIVNSNHKELIRELQEIHDRMNIEDWRDRLIHTAMKYKLKFNELENG